MPDIAMCRDENCPSRLKCYRFVATPSKWLQSYGGFGRETGDEKCGSFWPVRDAHQVRALNKAHEA